MRKHQHAVLALSVLAGAAAASTPASALDQITRPYWDPRVAAMGGVRITTGLYDENFFNNPARVTANPRFRFTILDVAAEGSSNLPSTIDKLTGTGDVIEKIADTAGDNNHGRVQTTFPAIYIPAGDGKWAFAIGVITSTQFDVDLRRNYNVVPQAITDIGPAVTVGRKFLEEDRLSVGATGHFTYRLASNTGFTLADVIRGRSLSPLKTGGQGAMVDFDLGATYRLPLGEGSPFRYTVGAALNNLLDGGYDNIKMQPVPDLGLLPPRQPRTVGFGLSATRDSWWQLTDTTVALEFTDIGNNPSGSLFRTVHLGAETHFGVLVGRLGVNQGYLGGGLGIDTRFFTLDLSTYGEELTLNPGGLQDRRYALKFGFQI